MLAVFAGQAATPLWAHIGSPAVVFDGAAGPYSVRVIVLPPAVVPGRAEINVRLREIQTQSDREGVSDPMPNHANAPAR